MSSFLCFICHNAVNSDTTEETRDKYREVVGMNLCPDSHLCFICCHMLNKLWLFRSVCLKRSLEYPVLFSEKCTLNLQRSDIETFILCSEETCLPTTATQQFYRYNNENRDHSNDYVELEDEHNDYDDYFTEKTVDNYQEILEGPYSVKDNSEVKGEATVMEFGNNVDGGNENFDDNDYGNDDGEKFESDKMEDVDIKIEEGDGNDEGVNENGGEDVKDDEEEPSKDPSQPKMPTKDYEKIILTLEEQKSELEAQRRSKKYLDAEFKCYNCGTGFLFKDSYTAHMMRHEESNGEYVCTVCTLRFASAAVLRSHKASHRERYSCNVCTKLVRKRQRETHARTCHGKGGDSAACHLCGNVFQDASGLQQHLKRFHMSKTSSRTYSCSVCGKTYNNQAAVRTHMIKHIQRKFTCDQCNTSYSSPYTLSAHKKKHIQTDNTKQYICDICSVRYSCRKSLLAHVRSAPQHQRTVFECPICSRVCPNSRSLTLHISRVHSATKDFECTRCDRKYTSRKGLLRHIRDHTSEPKPKMAQCHVCGKSFKSNSKLNRHLKEVCRKDKLEEELSAYQDMWKSVVAAHPSGEQA